MKTNVAKATVNKVLVGKNEPGVKRRSRWDINTGGTSRKDLNSLKYYSIYNSAFPDKQNIKNIEDEKIGFYIK